MKTRYFKKIFASALVVAAILGTSSCINDLDISPIDPQYAPSFDQNDVFVKEYALLGLTGQKGPAGSADLDGQDEGESGFYRTIFNCNELPSDECIWAWQTDVDIPQLTNIGWNSSSIRTEWGMPLSKLRREYGEKLYAYCLRMAQPHLKQGTLEIVNDTLKLTRAGIFISDGIMSDMLHVEDF